MKFRIVYTYNNAGSEIDYPWEWTVYRFIENCDVDNFPLLHFGRAKYKEYAIEQAELYCEEYTQNKVLEESTVYEVSEGKNEDS